MRRRHEFTADGRCEGCGNFTPIGEGDHLCIAEDAPKVVLKDYVPTEDYYWCRGSKEV